MPSIRIARTKLGRQTIPKAPPSLLTRWAVGSDVSHGASGSSQGGEVRRSFKARAVRLRDLPGVLSMDVAEARKLDVETAAEWGRLRELERRHKMLRNEHEMLEEAVRFASGRRRRSSSSSRQTGTTLKSR
jgi:transposase